MEKSRYIHEENVHNLDAAKEIVPELVKLLKPNSVVDFGCGLGTFLYCFKKEGLKQVLGLGGPWVNKELLYKYITPVEFKECNLEEEINLENKFDLVISLEVAEHLSRKYADIFIKNLIAAGEMIVFSASIPYQEGQNHINEQWLDYWEQKFLDHAYEMHDILRPIFWDNRNIFWWYKQNMVLFTPKESNFKSKQTYNVLKNVVHPEFFMHKAKRLEAIENGDAGIRTSLKYFVKSIKNKIQLIIKK